MDEVDDVVAAANELATVLLGDAAEIITKDTLAEELRILVGRIEMCRECVASRYPVLDMPYIKQTELLFALFESRELVKRM